LPPKAPDVRISDPSSFSGLQFSAPLHTKQALTAFFDVMFSKYEFIFEYRNRKNMPYERMFTWRWAWSFCMFITESFSTASMKTISTLEILIISFAKTVSTSFNNMTGFIESLKSIRFRAKKKQETTKFTV